MNSDIRYISLETQFGNEGRNADLIAEERPLVSVVVLTYNNVEDVYPTLDSVFAQDYPAIQLIISDDGSHGFGKMIDDLEQYISTRAGANILEAVVNSLSPNSGTVRNVNNALKLVRGEFFILLSAEDKLIGQHTLESYVIFMTDCDECDVCFGKLRGVAPDGSYQYKLLSCEDDYQKLKGYDGAQTLNRLFRRNFLPAPAAFFRRATIEKFGFHDEDMRLIEDYPYWINIMLNGGTFGYIDMRTVDYQLSGVSSAGSYSEAFMKDMFVIYDKYVFPNDRRFGVFQGSYNALKRWGLSYYMAKAQWASSSFIKKVKNGFVFAPLFALTNAQSLFNRIQNGGVRK